MTKLSVNINKIATLRTRGGNVPNLLNVATDIQNLAKESPYTLGLMSVTSVIKMPVI
jgi:pyridoxine 5'-phosphate synthase PdxJ